ncbi:MAG: efflux RND transporter periplasmic adaptor subunit [Pseudomonadota bacterium]
MSSTEKLWRMALAVLITLASGLYGCDDSSRADGVTGKRPTRPILVETIEVTTQPIPLLLESVGTLLGNESVTLTAKLTEQVSAVFFEGGELVKRGDVLVELIDQEQLALLREVQANVREARLQLERLQSLGKDIATAAEIDVSRARVDAGEAAVEALRVRISDRQIKAPFDGIVSLRQISVGALLTPGTVIAELDDIDPLKLDFTLPEKYFAVVQSGAVVTAYSAAWPDQPFEGVVNQVGSRVDATTRAFPVRARIDNAALKLRPGMLMTLEINVGDEPGILLPETALVQSGAQSYVYSVDSESKARRRSVVIGRRLPGSVEVRSGLRPGDRVVVSGQLTLRPGAVVAEANAKTAQVGLSSLDEFLTAGHGL